MVPSSAAATWPAATGAPVVVGGGQWATQLPKQVEVFFRSTTHRYSASPAPSVRKSADEPFAVVMVTLLEVAGVLFAPPPAEEPPLLQAAASTAAAESRTPTRTGRAMRASGRVSMCFSFVAGPTGEDGDIRRLVRCVLSVTCAIAPDAGAA